MKQEKSFKPFVPAERVLPEFTVASIVIGILLAVVFGQMLILAFEWE